MHYPFCFFIYFIFVLSVRAVEPEPVATMEEEAAHIETFTEAINRFQLERFMNPTNGELFNPNEVYSEIERIIDLGIGWYNINALELGDNGQEPILLQLHFGFLWMKFIHQFRMKGKVAFLKNAIRSIYKNDFHLSGVFLFWIGINTQEEKGVFLEKFCKILSVMFPSINLNSDFFQFLMNSETVVEGMEEFFNVNLEALQAHLDQYELPLRAIKTTTAHEEEGDRPSLFARLSPFYHNPNLQIVGIIAAIFCFMHTKNPQ